MRSRLGAIVATDLRLRFRRASTVVLFLLLGGSAYLWIPHPSTGRALIVIDGQRAIYNSAAIGMGTASLGTLFVGLFGFYAISNAFRHDLRSRCGFVIASTPVRDLEYLVGKLIGNLVFLSTFMAGYFLTSMMMLVVRAEAPLELGVFVRQYLLLTPPAIVMVAVLAIVFESVPFLAGRFGDVVYFFLWIASTSVAVIALEVGGPSFLRYVDFSGFAFMIDNMRQSLATVNFSIGATGFDPAKPSLVFGGLSLTSGWLLPRLLSAVLPLVLLPIALFSFHRFDPARVRLSATTRRRPLLGRFAGWLKPASKWLGVLRLGGRDGRVSMLSAARHDAFITLSTFPLAGLVIPAFALATSFFPLASVRQGVLPALFVVLAALVAGISSREVRAGTLALVWAVPGGKRHFVAWKLLSAFIVSLFLVLIPFLRLLLSDFGSALALLVGTFLVVAVATALGILTSNPKTFIVVFLSFWYVVVNDGGNVPALDFAGFHGSATWMIIAAYLALALVFVAVAFVGHHLRLRRQGM